MSSDEASYDSRYYDPNGDLKRCDECHAVTARQSLVMGLGPYCSGDGDLLCAKCLNKHKSTLYLVSYHGMRRIFCTAHYYSSVWDDDPKVKVVRTPKDHAEAERKRRMGKPKKSKTDKATKASEKKKRKLTEEGETAQDEKATAAKQRSRESDSG